MSEVKPWMRRAAKDCFDDHQSQCIVANNIAAHAPPVEEMVEALRHTSWCQWCADGDCDDPNSGRSALKLYDSWLAKQEGK